MDSVELVDSYRDALLLAFSSAKVIGCYNDSVKCSAHDHVVIDSGV